jgi:hypothetical protein
MNAILLTSNLRMAAASEDDAAPRPTPWSTVGVVRGLTSGENRGRIPCQRRSGTAAWCAGQRSTCTNTPDPGALLTGQRRGAARIHEPFDFASRPARSPFDSKRGGDGVLLEEARRSAVCSRLAARSPAPQPAQPLRLPPVQDRFHDVGRRQVGGRSLADVGIRHALVLRKVGDRVSLPALDPAPPAMRSNQHLDQRLVWAWLRRGTAVPSASGSASDRPGIPGTSGAEVCPCPSAPADRRRWDADGHLEYGARATGARRHDHGAC